MASRSCMKKGKNDLSAVIHAIRRIFKTDVFELKIVLLSKDNKSFIVKHHTAQRAQQGGTNAPLHDY